MILVLEATNSFPPNVIVCRRLFAGIFASVANQPHNFLFVITLIVRTVKFGRDCRHVGKHPSSFRKVEHLPFRFCKHNIFSLRFFDNSGDQELFCFTRTLEGIHGYCADSTMVPESWAGSLRIVLVTSTFDRQSVVTVTASPLASSRLTRNYQMG